MGEANVVIECRDCEFCESFANLGRARVALDDHESEAGHYVDWQINRVADGVERAGADAGICGVSGRENPDSALLDRGQPDEP
ncbi:DUF7542 family protein [Natronorubrum tibetense]|uniref:Uncharacterized protein n=1 Tax=Natronorubrum tibetense GA33 TaxID=1114856 RepID=L9WB23_9EURY|nr:hypothetical protein [Natronorubrum tibetense]ELY46476.1 hypothetical protein C496_00995 [Natronorubrum tibetense GA33]